MKNILNPVIVFSLFYLVFYLKKEALYITALSHIDILTALDWLKAQPHWLGPQIPHQTGSLPGPFFYFLIMPPLLLNNPYTSLILYTLAWLSLTFTAAFYFVKNITKNTLSPVLFLTLLLTSSFFIENIISLPLNSLFSLLFHLAVLIGLFKWQERKNDLWLLFIGLFMGLGIQIHHSILFHIITFLIFLITDPRIQTKQFGWKYLLASISLLLLPQIPFLSVLLDEERHLYIKGFELDYVKNQLIAEFFSNPLKNLKELLISLDIYGLKPAMRLFFMFLLTGAGFIYKKLKTEKYFFDDSILSLLIITLQPILCAFLFLFIDSHFNSFFIFLFSIIAFVKFYDSLWPKNIKLSSLFLSVFAIAACASNSLGAITELLNHSAYQLILTALLFFIFYISFNLMKAQRKALSLFSKIKTPQKWDKAAGNLFYKLSWGLLIVLIIMLSPKITSSRPDQLKTALKYIYKETSWNDKKALQRIFQIGFKKEDFLFYYRLAKEELNAKSFNENQKNNLGYFVVFEESANSHKNSVKYWKNWLLKKSLPYEAQEEIKNGSIIIKSAHKTSRQVFVISYQIENASRFPKGFHNLSGADYKEPGWSEDYCYFPSLLKNKNTFYLCHVLYNYIGEKVSFRFSFSNQQNKGSFLRATLAGYPITIGNNERKGGHLIENLTIHFYCGEKKEKIKILSSIGNDRVNIYRSFLAPIELKYPLKCKNINQIKKLKVKFQSQIGYSEKKELYYSYPPEL